MNEYIEPSLWDYISENKWYVVLSFLAVLVPVGIAILNGYTTWKKAHLERYENGLYIDEAKLKRSELLAENKQLNVEIRKAQAQTILRTYQLSQQTKEAAMAGIEFQQKVLERVTTPYIEIDNISVSDGILKFDIENIGANPINHIEVGAYCYSTLNIDGEKSSFHQGSDLDLTIAADDFFVKHPEAEDFEKRLTKSIRSGQKRNFQFSIFREDHVAVLLKSHGENTAAEIIVKLDFAIDNHELDVGKNTQKPQHVELVFSVKLNDLNVPAENISISNRRPSFVFNTERFLKFNGDGTATLTPPSKQQVRGDDGRK
ncbi:hypothetical protein KFE96_07950 [Kordiimonas sp. SCSIO 12603]|uniref:hypothetical protein n=1 Tax=Kordiimonas sp. SCSIO 12603 TaxID=2829596 RepID=UPI002102BF37|nr:hypothetical protein [Kordiimonas sp. SCSIO 12603]UTW60234.1 hypothetical protein KFE96_07950 [Kordiimonas sp. SCSIO 12603]